MIKVGLTGGYATGKTFVAHELERLGCHVIHADRLGHTVLEPGGEAYEPVIRAFGSDILMSDGTVDRKKLASIVFTDPLRLQALNSLVHPPVFRLEEQMLRAFEQTDPRGLAVIEAAILIEAGRHTLFDRLIVTTCSLETQIARGMARDKITREQVLARLERQMPLEEKTRYANYIIETNGPKAATIKQVRRVYEELKGLAVS